MAVKVATSGVVVVGLVHLTLVGVTGFVRSVVADVLVLAAAGGLGGASTKKTVTSRA